MWEQNLGPLARKIRGGTEIERESHESVDRTLGLKNHDC